VHGEVKKRIKDKQEAYSKPQTLKHSNTDDLGFKFGPMFIKTGIFSFTHGENETFWQQPKLLYRMIMQDSVQLQSRETMNAAISNNRACI